MVGYRKQLWGVLHFLVLSVLWEVMVSHIAYCRLYVTEYVFPVVHHIKHYNDTHYLLKIISTEEKISSVSTALTAMGLIATSLGNSVRYLH